MSKVYNLQVNLKENVKYSRADHSYSTILKKNLQFFSVIVKLPSGVRKIFSIFSIGYKQELQSSPKNFLFDSSAKRLYLKGLSPRSRGVAKNPVDHPHGGRTKSLRYPRTP
jgi:large subunit ribosomal protein L2